MTLWGAPYPLEAKVTGVYKHNIHDDAPGSVERMDISESSNQKITYFTSSGQRVSSPVKGINIVKYSDGRTSKIVL